VQAGTVQMKCTSHSLSFSGVVRHVPSGMSIRPVRGRYF
jgi:hypothetical protein